MTALIVRSFSGIMATFIAVWSLRFLQDQALFPLSLSASVSMFYLPAAAIVAGVTIFGAPAAFGIVAAYFVLHASQGSLDLSTGLVSLLSPVAILTSLFVARRLVGWQGAWMLRDKNAFFCIVMTLYPLLNAGIHAAAFAVQGRWAGVDTTLSMMLGDFLGAALGMLVIVLFHIPMLNDPRSPERPLPDWLDKPF